jgi:hypothetical protein
MTAKKIKTYYSAVEHLESFWEAVSDFIAVKEAEGKRVASALMTDCVAANVGFPPLRDGGELMLRTSALQEKAVHSLRAFLVALRKLVVAVAMIKGRQKTERT